MSDLGKRYRIKALKDDGTYQNTYAFDLETALAYAKKVNGEVYAVYSKQQSNAYMDADEYVVEVKK